MGMFDGLLEKPEPDKIDALRGDVKALAASVRALVAAIEREFGKLKAGEAGIQTVGHRIDSARDAINASIRTMTGEMREASTRELQDRSAAAHTQLALGQAFSEIDKKVEQCLLRLRLLPITPAGARVATKKVKHGRKENR